MTSIHATIARNLARIRERIADAALRSGRRPVEITLVGVTKYVTPDVIRELIVAGCRDLGEARPQQLWDRAEHIAAEPLVRPSSANPTDAIDSAVRWHLIGHLQRNKIRRTLPCLHLLHSADSQRLIEACGVEAIALGRTLPVLLEVNISGDAAKHGFRPEELPGLIETLGAIRGVDIRGLMAMSGLASDAEQTRREFAAVRDLRDRLQAQCPLGIQLRELSMGMSGDFEIAIEEGATLVRVGSALFEGLHP